MNNKIKTMLMPFYFGSIEDSDRLTIERELLIDSEVLLDYLDLKRKIESAETIPVAPSPYLWQRLQAKVRPRKKLVLFLSLGMAVAASVIIFSLFLSKPKTPDLDSFSINEILFDASHELPVSSGVL